MVGYLLKIPTLEFNLRTARFEPVTVLCKYSEILVSRCLVILAFWKYRYSQIFLVAHPAVLAGYPSAAQYTCTVEIPESHELLKSHTVEVFCLFSLFTARYVMYYTTFTLARAKSTSQDCSRHFLASGRT
jgi:hypothetical protein